MDISIVLATRDRPDILRRTLESFSRFEGAILQWDLWVVDNAGDPATEKVCKDWVDKLPIHYLVEPKAGKNHALNRALLEVRGQLIVLTDDDIIAASDWLVQLWEGAHRWPDHMIFGGRIIADWPGEEAFWGEDHPMNQSLFGLHSLGEKEKPYYDNLLPYGANMAVRRAIFEKNYKFNPGFGPNGRTLYKMGSEVEFLQRLRNDGYGPVFLPKALVKHQIRAEQLKMEWVSQRSFRSGYTDFNPLNRVRGKTLFSVDMYLWRQLLVSISSCYFHKIFGKKRKYFESFVKMQRTRGKIFAQIEMKRNLNDSFLYENLSRVIGNQ